MMERPKIATTDWGRFFLTRKLTITKSFGWHPRFRVEKKESSNRIRGSNPEKDCRTKKGNSLPILDLGRDWDFKKW